MRKSAMRVLACSLAAMVAFSALTPAKTARAESSIPRARAGAESGVLPVLEATEENPLYLTADMAYGREDGKEIIVSGGSWERIVVPKEIGAVRIILDEVEVGELIVESGSSAYVLLREVEAEKVTVEEPKLKEIDWTALKHLLADAQTSGQAIEYYTRVQAENSRYLSSFPRIVTAGKRW